MKIGIDISSVVYGTGVSDYTLNLVQALQKTNSENLVLFGASLRRKSELTRIFPEAHTFLIPPTLLDAIWNKLHVLRVENFIGKVDVFHSSDWTEPPATAQKVTTVHDLSPFLYPQEMDPKIVQVHTRKMGWAVKECAKFICVSQNTANDLRRLFSVNPSKIMIIPEALPNRFLRIPQLTKFTNYLMTIGARQSRKNTAKLVSAYLNFRQKYDLPQKLIIVGENTDLISDPAVSYTGYVDDQTLVNLLAGAEAFVYPSLYEGFGLPILGAFYHGVAVACSNTSSLPEVAGDAAEFFDPIDEEDMVKAIRQAIDNKDDLVSKGNAQLKKFSWSQTAAETVKVYESLL